MRGRRCGQGKGRTKLVSAAVVSCCSAAPRIVASRKNQCANSCHLVTSSWSVNRESFTSRKRVQQHLIDVHDGGSRTCARVFAMVESVELRLACKFRICG